MRTFTFTDDKSNKFWNIELKGKAFTVQFGRIGAAGQTQIKEFADEAAAKKEHDKLVTEKLKKGYTETTPGGAPAAQAAPPATKPAKAETAPPPAPAPSPPPAPPSASGRRTFAYSDASSHKFWNIELKGAGFTVTYGRQGTAGQTQEKSFRDEAAARKEHDKLVTEKLKKGYTETTPLARPAPTSLQESLESALVEKPDDLASHMAYADYLGEQGDPLGEFIRVQLQLEDQTKSRDERAKLQQQEQKLLYAHGPTWLGDLAPFLLEQKAEKNRAWNDMEVMFTFVRGWLDSLEASYYTVAFTRALARSPRTRLLRRLALAHNAYEPEGEYEAGDDIPEECDSPQLYPLIRSPYLSNVRVLIVGKLMTPEEDNDAGSFNCETHAEGVVGLVKQMPKLEELYLLAQGVDADQLFSLKTLHNLQILQLYHNNSYPLARLAKNPSLGKLTHLLFHPHALEDDPFIRLPGVKALVRSPELPSLTHLRLRLSDMGDAGVKEIVASGILKRLKVLDLRHGCITDEGARRLAACPDVKNLELLDLTSNALTKAGVAALETAGVKLAANNQWRITGDEYGDREYLYAGDIE